MKGDSDDTRQQWDFLSIGGQYLIRNVNTTNLCIFNSPNPVTLTHCDPKESSNWWNYTQTLIKYDSILLAKQPQELSELRKTVIFIEL